MPGCPYWKCPDYRLPLIDMRQEQRWFEPAPAIDGRQNGRGWRVTPWGETAAQWVEPTSLSAIREIEAYGMDGAYGPYGAKPLDPRIADSQRFFVPARPEPSWLPPPFDIRTMTPVTMFPYRYGISRVVADALPLP